MDSDSFGRGFVVPVGYRHPAGDARPGTSYCTQGGEKEWKRILERSGWKFIQKKGDYWILQRPGKDRGGSATLGFCKTDLGPELYVFSSNADPFKPESCYSLFSARAILEFGGDFKRCAKQCLKEGYGLPAPDEFTDIVQKIINKLSLELQEKKVLLEESIISKWKDIDKRFAKTFELKREKDFQGDPDSYTNSLLIWCKKYFKDEKNIEDADYWIEFAVRLLYQFYKIHNFDSQRALDVRYISQKAYNVLKYQYKSDAQVYQDIQDAEVGDEPELVLQWIQKTMNLPIKHYYMSQEEGFHWFVLSDGKKVDIGPTDNLRNANKLEAQLYAHDLQPYNYPGTLDPPIKTASNYPNLLRQLYKIRKTTDNSKDEDIISWISDMLCRHGLARETDEGGLQRGVDRRTPLYYGQRVWVNLEKLRKYVNDRNDERYSLQQLKKLITAVDPAEVIDCRKRGDQRRNPVRYWGIPEGYFDKEILLEEAPQID